MGEEKILKKVISMFAAMTDADEVTADSEIMDDLGVTSMDVLMIVTGLEEEFRIRVPEKKLRKVVTVGDVADMVADLVG